MFGRNIILSCLNASLGNATSFITSLFILTFIHSSWSKKTTLAPASFIGSITLSFFITVSVSSQYAALSPTTTSDAPALKQCLITACRKSMEVVQGGGAGNTKLGFSSTESPFLIILPNPPIASTAALTLSSMLLELFSMLTRALPSWTNLFSFMGMQSRTPWVFFRTLRNMFAILHLCYLIPEDNFIMLLYCHHFFNTLCPPNWFLKAATSFPQTLCFLDFTLISLAW